FVVSHIGNIRARPLIWQWWAEARHELRNAPPPYAAPLCCTNFVLGGTLVFFACHWDHDHLGVRRGLREQQSGLSCFAVTGGNAGTPADDDSCTSTDCDPHASTSGA